MGGVGGMHAQIGEWAELGFDARNQFATRYHAVVGNFGDAGEGHHLDEANIPGPFAGQGRHIDDIVVVESTHHHHVEFDGQQSGGFGGGNARPDIAEFGAAGHIFEAFSIERVDADIDAVESGGFEVGGNRREFDGIGGHGDMLDAGDGFDLRHQRHQIAAQGGLAPRQTNFAESDRGSGADDSN
jgi:hypothetical protein